MPLASRPGEPSANLRSLVHRIHCAADDAAGWGEALELLRVRLDARCVHLGAHDFSSGAGEILFGVPRDEGFADACAKFAVRNPWFLSSVEYRPGRVMLGEELIGHRELKRTDFYRSVLKPHGVLHRLCGVASRSDELAYFVTALRGEHQRPFAAREVAELKMVLAHVSLSLQHRWRSREADDFAKAIMRIVDQAGHATLLVTAEGEIIYRSLRVGKLEGPATGFGIRDGCLVATAAGDARALREALQAATRAGATADEAACCRVLAVGGETTPRPMMVTVRPGGEMFSAKVGRAVQLAVLTVKGAPAEHDVHACAFARWFELTPAQAKVSALVFAGHPLSGVAQMLCVSDNTVRSHLKQVYQKTNTHGQMQLVHLHAQICAD